MTKVKAELKRELDRLHYATKDVKRALERYREESAKLEEEIEVAKEKVAELEALIAKRDEDIDEMEGLLAEKERLIAQLDSRLKALLNVAPTPPPPKMLPKGDLLDEMIGQYIHQANCPVPIKKLGNGYYIFGTRKIYAKILNGKLVIRVGGGYMIIEEFINTYAEQELTKLNKIQEQQAALEDLDDVESLDITPGTRGGSSKDISTFSVLLRTVWQWPLVGEEPEEQPRAGAFRVAVVSGHGRCRERNIGHAEEQKDQPEDTRSHPERPEGRQVHREPTTHLIDAFLKLLLLLDMDMDLLNHLCF